MIDPRTNDREHKYWISNVAIKGFWGIYDFDFALDPHVNFFIGQNGAGKTTLINLLAATLTADFRALDRISFKSVTVSLQGRNSAETPSIVLSKSNRENKKQQPLEYSIIMGDVENKFALPDFEDRFYHPDIFIMEDLRRRTMARALYQASILGASQLAINTPHLTERALSGRTLI